MKKAQPASSKTAKATTAKATKAKANKASNAKTTKNLKAKTVKSTAIAAPIKAQPAVEPSTRLSSAWLTTRSFGIVLAAVLLLIGVVAVIWSASDGKFQKPASSNSANSQYLNQVDTETGAPRSGRDPATQQQTSLQDAASRPNGAASSGDIVGSAATTTARTTPTGTHDDHDGHSEPSDVIADPKQTGVLVNGCYADYGKPGEECVPSHAAENGKLTCNGVRNHGFPNGVKVTGTDRFGLDKNGDKIACNKGD